MLDMRARGAFAFGKPTDAAAGAAIYEPLAQHSSDFV